MMKHPFIQNLICGFCYCFFLPIKNRAVNTSWHSFVSIIALFIFTQWLSDAIINGQNGSRFYYNDDWHVFHVMLMAVTLLTGYAVTKITNGDDRQIIKLTVNFYNAYYFIFIPFLILETIWPEWYKKQIYDSIHNLIYIWVFLIAFRLISEISKPTVLRHISATLVMVFSIYILHQYSDFNHFYYDYSKYEKEEPEFPEYEKLTGEELFNSQTDLLQKQLSEFKPSAPGTTDIYGISFGSYANQDVFMREARYVSERMRDILGIKKGVLTLINNPETALDLPLANTTNLKAAINHIANNMQNDEDILFLYFTSHGSKKSGLSVRLEYKHTMLNLNGEQLAKILEENKIKNTVIIISACHSGAFIPHLQNDDTMIITSAAENKQSYGCTDEADLTYFAQAYFKEALSETTDLEKAFRLAKEKIEKREKDEELKRSSDPQIFIGKNIRKTLETYQGPKLSHSTETQKTKENDE